jgi:hypothetical protein
VGKSALSETTARNGSGVSQDSNCMLNSAPVASPHHGELWKGETRKETEAKKRERGACGADAMPRFFFWSRILQQMQFAPLTDNL